VEALSPVNNNAGQADTAKATSNTNAQTQNAPVAQAAVPLWAIVVIIFGSLLIGMVLVFTIRQGKKF
jgi:beta-lactamase regulating signal transducer with metallopeptidase domain